MILTHQEFILNENMASDLIKKIKDYLIKVKEDLNLNLKFILTFGTSITAFIPVVNSIIANENIEIDFKGVVLLTICALAMAFGEDKKNYKKLFEELRLRGVYHLLKKLINFVLNLKKVFSAFAKRSGRIIKGLIDMFAYTALFIPFLIVVESIIRHKGLDLDSFTNMSLGKSIITGVGAISIKHFIEEVLDRFKKFNPVNIKPIQDIINKFKEDDVIDEIEGNLISKVTGDTDTDTDSDIIDVDVDVEDDEKIEKIDENRYNLLEEEWGSLGEYVEHLKDNTEDKEDFIRKIGSFLPEDTTDIRLANIINTLDTYDQRYIVNIIEEDFLNESLDIFIDDYEKFKKGGKMSFNSFIKALTALNVKDNFNYDETPKKFTYFISHKDISREKALKVFKRFKSLTSGLRIIENIKDPLIGLYWGIKHNENKIYMEYGVLDLSENKMYMIGDFKLTKYTIKRLLKKNNKVLEPIKPILKDWDLRKEKLLGEIKERLTLFSPGYYQRKSKVFLDNDKCVQQGFYGVGKWMDGDIDSTSIEDIKDKFKQWICDQKWRDKVLISCKANKFWIYFKIKIKR